MDQTTWQHVHPWKLPWNPKNGGLEDENPFQRGDFQVPAVSFRGRKTSLITADLIRVMPRGREGIAWHYQVFGGISDAPTCHQWFLTWGNYYKPFVTGPPKGWLAINFKQKSCQTRGGSISCQAYLVHNPKGHKPCISGNLPRVINPAFFSVIFKRECLGYQLGFSNHPNPMFFWD